ncbi:hypothetical protein LNV08_11710 [Paucibacter sp. TC2R-5]|uniref:hypothetical protein n=1 Tax=Paucibacter sp. TC2R-5 TaxID=2893555 RepID=UPI0021E3FCEA|nr:hypothetical protein [Paucibacter sp. TC2R-5]MCV2359635.1 hypothetical protein [Paucibacter sp. TC2R-5]
MRLIAIEAIRVAADMTLEPGDEFEPRDHGISLRGAGELLAIGAAQEAPPRVELVAQLASAESGGEVPAREPAPLPKPESEPEPAPASEPVAAPESQPASETKPKPARK